MPLVADPWLWLQYPRVTVHTCTRIRSSAGRTPSEAHRTFAVSSASEPWLGYTVHQAASVAGALALVTPALHACERMCGRKRKARSTAFLDARPLYCRRSMQ